MNLHGLVCGKFIEWVTAYSDGLRLPWLRQL